MGGELGLGLTGDTKPYETSLLLSSRFPLTLLNLLFRKRIGHLYIIIAFRKIP